MALPVLGLAVFFGWNWLQGGETPKGAWRDFQGHLPRAEAPTETPLAAAGVAAPKPAERSVAAPRGKSRGEIALIIDDIGFDGQPLQKLMALDPNINLSILPNGTKAREFAEVAHARGFEILCHLPMEPAGKASPGRGAILTSMADAEIAKLTRDNVDGVPHAIGVNNHMGSRATSDRRVMSSVLRALPDGLYFIDSRTSGDSVAGSLAREMSIPNATRHVFLDDVASEAAVRKQVRELAAAAEKRGVAIGIGHPYPVTLRVLAEEMPELRRQGFRFVRASQVVK
jgi:polysaccharide deacetylase 2 family uncharacterized protein YibQ